MMNIRKYNGRGEKQKVEANNEEKQTKRKKKITILLEELLVLWKFVN